MGLLGMDIKITDIEGDKKDEILGGYGNFFLMSTDVIECCLLI